MFHFKAAFTNTANYARTNNLPNIVTKCAKSRSPIIDGCCPTRQLLINEKSWEMFRGRVYVNKYEEAFGRSLFFGCHENVISLILKGGV